MNNCIYRFTSPSGKSYIGQAKDFFKRLIQHQNAAKKGKKSKFYDAVRKYNGLKNFKIEIIHVNLNTKIERDAAEKFYISFYNTFGENGYNMTPGGDGVQLFGEYNGMYNKSHSIESIQKMKDSEWNRKRPTGKDNPRYGWRPDKSQSKNISEGAKRGAITKKNNILKLSLEDQKALKEKTSKIQSIAAIKGHETRKLNESLLSDDELIKLRAKRSETSKKSYNDLSSKKKRDRVLKRAETFKSKSKEEIELINKSKACNGEKNGRSKFFILTDPEENEFLVFMNNGLKEFCEINNLVFNVLKKHTGDTVPIHAKRDNKYKKDEKYRLSRDNTVGWKLIQYRRIKI